MQRNARTGLLAAAVLTVVSTVIATPAAQGEDLADQVYYETEVEFADGSAITARPDTGEQRVTASRDGSPGAAKAALASGAVVTTLTDGSTDAATDDGATTDGTDMLPPGDSGEETVRAHAAIVDPPAGGAGDVSTQADTPDGFRLYGTNTTAYGYVYTSDWLGTKLRKCVNGVCEVIGRVDNRIKEYLYGGDSIRWKITPRSVYRFGPVFSVDFEYWCGVNLKWQSDITCRTDDDTASPSGEDFNGLASYSVGDESWPFIRSFGKRHADNAKYPLIEMRTTWPGYPVTVTERFRGWDIRRYSGVWKMAPASGTGY